MHARAQADTFSPVLQRRRRRSADTTITSTTHREHYRAECVRARQSICSSYARRLGGHRACAHVCLLAKRSMFRNSGMRLSFSRQSEWKMCCVCKHTAAVSIDLLYVHAQRQSRSRGAEEHTHSHTHRVIIQNRRNEMSLQYMG